MGGWIVGESCFQCRRKRIFECSPRGLAFNRIGNAAGVKLELRSEIKVDADQTGCSRAIRDDLAGQFREP